MGKIIYNRRREKKEKKGAHHRPPFSSAEYKRTEHQAK